MADLFNNIFSDLGPLVSLFGENFATQFLSESFTSWDHIVFAMGPVGIITAFVGAIRLAGPSWLRAIIGIAQENRGEAEVELVSSTSGAVCELWNGQSVTRAVGDPLVKQIVVLRQEKDTSTFGLYTLDTAKKAQLMKSEEYNGPSFTDLLAKWQSSSDSKKRERHINNNTSCTHVRDAASAQNGTLHGISQHGSAKIGIETDIALEGGPDPFRSDPEDAGSLDEGLRGVSEDKQAPNILLNLHYSSKIEELVFASIVGIILQGCVLVYGAVVTYLSALTDDVDAGSDTVGYGYPLLATGTILMTAGLMISASVIERSSTETRWLIDGQKAEVFSQPAGKATLGKQLRGADQDMQVVWLQQQQSLGAHTFYSFVLRSDGDCKEIFTSRPTRELEGLEPITPDDQLNFMDRFKRKIQHTRIGKIFDRHHLSALTVIGSFTGLVGYIVQFQGIRSVDWTVSVAQLGTVIIMSVLRAWLRRGLTAKPHFTSAIHEHEMDCLASEMAMGNIEFWPEDKGGGRRCKKSTHFCLPFPRLKKSPNATVAQRPMSEKLYTKFPAHTPLAVKDPLAWSLLLAYKGALLDGDVERGDLETPSYIRDELSAAQRALDIRCRLGTIIDWSSPVLSQAKAVGTAIQEVMNKFLTSGSRFLWQFDIPFDNTAQKVTIDFRREHCIGSTKQGHWEDATSKIEAAMSLWLYHAKKQVMDHVDAPSSVQQAPLSEQVAYRWVLGPDTDGCLSRNLAWWSGAELALERGPAEWFAEHWIIGCRGMHTAENLDTNSLEDEPQYLSTTGLAKMEQIIAWNLFESFMMAIAKYVTRDAMTGQTSFYTKEGFDMYHHETWTNGKVVSPTLEVLLRDLKRTGLGTFEEVSMLVITALSYANKVPSGVLVDYLRLKVRDNETIRHYDAVLDVYKELVRLIKGDRSMKPDRGANVGVSEFFRYKAVAAVVEFLVNVSDADSTGKWAASIEEIRREIVEIPNPSPRAFSSKKARRNFWTHTGSLMGILIDVGALYKKQHRWEEFNGLFASLQLDWSEVDEAEKAIEDNLELGDHLGFTRCHAAVFKKRNLSGGDYVRTWIADGLRSDVLGWSCLHYAAILRPEVYEIAASHLNVSSRNEPKDLAERTPLHHVSRVGELGAVQFLHRHSDVNAVGRRNALPIHWAGKRGDPAMVEELLKYGSEVDALDNSRRSALFLAIENGHAAAARALLAAGADARTKRLDGTSALHRAATLGDVRLIRQLIRQGADVEAQDRDGQTALHYACNARMPKAADALYSSKPALGEVQDRAGRNPLHLAAKCGDYEIVRLLLGNRAIPKIRDRAGNLPILAAASSHNPDVLDLLYSRTSADEDIKNNRGEHPLDLCSDDPRMMQVVLDNTHDFSNLYDEIKTAWALAVENRDGAVFDMLQQRFGNQLDASRLRIRDDPLFNAVISREPSAVHNLIKEGYDSEVRSDQGETPLMLATRRGWVEVIDELLKSGANFDVFDSEGLGPLHKAAMGGFVDTIRILWRTIQFSTGVSAIHNIDIPTSNAAGDSPLLLASKQGHQDAVQCLISYGARVNFANLRNETPTKVAINGLHSGVLQALISHSADVVTSLESLQKAVLAGHDGILQAVFDHPSNKKAMWQEQVLPSGKTLLHTAVEGENSSIVSVLLRAGADANAEISKGSQDRRIAGYTAVHLALTKGDFPVVKILLDRGASLGSRNAAGRTPVEEVEYNSSHGYPGPTSAEVDAQLRDF